MARVFISHASENSDFATRLSDDLIVRGHEPWLDKWEIRVGDDIVQSVERGVSESDYVAILLTPEAVNSGWVDREWRIKYWDEVQSGRIQVLPALVLPCDIPPLLKTKRYADFIHSYAVGFVDLIAALEPTSRTPGPILVDPTPPRDVLVSRLIARTQSTTVPLSQLIAETLELAREGGNAQLEDFARKELVGYPTEYARPSIDDSNKHRVIEMFVSASHTINFSYWGWGGDSAKILRHMRENPNDFVPQKWFVPYSVSQLEGIVARKSSSELSPSK